MTGIAWMVVAIVLGCLLVFRFSELQEMAPRWAGWLLIFSAGTAIGIGLTSCLFFLSRLAVPAVPLLSMAFEFGALLWVGYQIFRKRVTTPSENSVEQFPWNLALAGAVVLALVLVTAVMNVVWGSNPQGNWDAWSIWNLRAKFLAATGDLSHRAWSPELSFTHPEYPLLTSAFIARCWVYAGNTSIAVPIATSYMFLLALLSLAIGGLAALRSPSLGLLLALALLGSPMFLEEVPSQYADIPLACYFLGTLIFMLLDRPVLAGAFAGLAAWTKDEGVLFLAVFLVAMVFFRRRQLSRLAAGAVPGVVLTLLLKLVLARGAATLLGRSSSALFHNLSDGGRYLAVIGGLGGEVAGIASNWYHPFLPALIAALMIRFDRVHRRDMLFSGGITGVTLLGYFMIYVITPNDLTWQLHTSLNRLFIQVWPLMLLALFTGLRTPEASGSSDKTRRKTKA